MTSIFPRVLIASAATLLLGAAARADVIYSGLQNIGIPTDFTGVYIDIDTGTTGTSEFAGWDVNPFFGGQGIANSPLFQPVRIGTGSEDTILRLGVGATVSSSSTFSTGYGGSSDHIGSQFTSGQEGYIGFKLTTNSNAGPYFGWARVVLTSNTSGGVVKDWAYDTTSGSILTGRVQMSSPVSNLQTLTLSGNSGESYTLGTQVSDTGGNTTALLKTGAGSWKLTGNNSHSGSTAVTGGTLEVGNGASISGTAQIAASTGGSLLLSGSGGVNTKLNSGAAVTLSGGRIDLSGMSSSLDQRVGALTLTVASVLDFGTLASGNTFRFADSSAQSWSSGESFSIWNWTPGVDHLFFGTNSNALTATQLSAIQFYSDNGSTLINPTSAFLATGELVPVPEPATWLSAAGLLALVGWREWRKRRKAGNELEKPEEQLIG